MPRHARTVGGHLFGERCRRVHDDLVVQEEREVRRPLERRAGPRRGIRLRNGRKRGEPQAQVGEPRERPLGRRALHDEVAGEPAAIPRPPAGACSRRRRMPPARSRATARRASCGRRRGAAAEPRRDDPARLAGRGRRRRPCPSRAGTCGAAAARGVRCRPSSTPYIAPSIAIFASARVATAPVSTMPAYRSGPRAASASASSRAMAASTRGSSCATSATTRRQPGSARTALRSCRGSCSAPPPDDAQRPVTTPPGT